MRWHDASVAAWIERARSVPILNEIERRDITLKRVGTEYVGPCPKCGGEDRFAINVTKQVFNCRGCQTGGDVIKLVEHLDDCGFEQACTTLAGEPPPKPNGKTGNGRDTVGAVKKLVVAEFRYLAEDGTLQFVVERIEFQNWDGTFVEKDGKRKKTFKQKRPDPDKSGNWIWNVDGVPPLLYRLPEVIEAVGNDRKIYITEGEGKADLLWSWNVAATCCAGGAEKWRAEHSEWLRGADAVLLPDADDRGFKHVQQVGAALSGIAKRLRVLILPDLSQKGDIIDWVAAGGTREALDQLVEQAPDWQTAIPASDKSDGKAKAEADENAIIEALAKMRPGIEFARQRKKAARELAVPQDAIDDELEARRSERTAAPMHGHWIVQPWPEPVDGNSLLRDIVQRIRRHVVCSHYDALAISLWIMLAWVHDEVATHSPILNINSAESESGKSTTLGLISFLAPRCVSSVEISEAALYRAIELWRPSLVIDEFDNVLASEDKTALRSVINSGHTRGQGVVRCVEPDFTPKMFNTFCPKAIGMIGRKLPTTTLGRCIIVELRRRKVSEPIEQFAHEDDPELGQLRSRIARWAADNKDALRYAEPTMPEAFDNQRADNWRVMFAIADLAGADWGNNARFAAAKLEGASDTTSIGVRLLADIKRIRDEEVKLGHDCILSAVLVERLKEDPEQPWAEWNRGKGLTQNSLATLLGGGGGRGRGSRGGFGIRSQNVTPSPGVQGKGYKWDQFEEAWARYLPCEISPSTDEGGG